MSRISFLIRRRIILLVRTTSCNCWAHSRGLFYGFRLRSGDWYDSLSERPRDELEGEDCKANGQRGKKEKINPEEIH